MTNWSCDELTGSLFCTCYLWLWLGPPLTSDDNAICYVLPVLWMSSCFHIVTVGIAQIKDDAYVSSSSPGSGTSRMSDNVVCSRRQVAAPEICQCQSAGLRLPLGMVMTFCRVMPLSNGCAISKEIFVQICYLDYKL